MAGRLAIDFGTCNTTVALWNPGQGTSRTVALPGLSLAQVYQGHEFHVVPSLIHYDGTRVYAGRQVNEDEQLRSAPATFRWMKTYIANRMKLPRRIGERTIDFLQAGSDFLKQVIIASGGLSDLTEEEVCVTVPVEAFEHYQNWLDSVLQEAGVARPVYLDEASAAALGYAAHLRPGEVFMVFDFGGGTADVSVVKPEAERDRLRCRSLGKAGAQSGGSSIDDWILRHVLKESGRKESDARRLGGLLLPEAERVKIALSTQDQEEFVVMDTASGAVITHTMRRTALEDLMEEHGLYAKLNTILDLAEAQAREYGHSRDDLKACLMTGGSSLIPSVRRLVRMRYGERCRFERPFDAVASGAAAYVAGAGFDDRVRHAYALRPYDREIRDYIYRTIVTAGTSYPCAIMRPDRPGEPLVLTIRASHDAQTKLGIQVYEVAHRESAACGKDGLSLVYDQNGGACYQKRDDIEEETHRPIGTTSFIIADPPAALGDPRFQAGFIIDRQKRLCITVKDVKTGKVLMRDYPLVKLT